MADDHVPARVMGLSTERGYGHHIIERIEKSWSTTPRVHGEPGHDHQPDQRHWVLGDA